jgi:hypothetical protein
LNRAEHQVRGDVIGVGLGSGFRVRVRVKVRIVVRVTGYALRVTRYG